MPVLVTGATGCVGRALVPKLVEAGGQVRVYVRRDVREYRALRVKVAIGEADHEGRLESALEQVHTIVHLVGGPVPDRGVSVEWLNLDTTQVAIRAAQNAEVRRFLFLSPVGADAASPNEYLAAKGGAEEAIRSSGLEHAIFRCAPILGPGSALARLLDAGVPTRARASGMNPIAAADVAAALVAADTRENDVAGSWELGGPEELMLGELASRTRSRGGVLRRADRRLVDLYTRDSIADPRDAVTQFGLRLTPLDEVIDREVGNA